MARSTVERVNTNDVVNPHPLPRLSWSDAHTTRFRTTASALLLLLALLVLSGCPTEEPSDAGPLFVVGIDLGPNADEATVEIFTEGDLSLSRTVRSDGRPIELDAPRCYSRAVATTDDGHRFEVGKLCPGDVWTIGDDTVVRRPSRERLMALCAETQEADGASVDALAALATYGLSERWRILEFLEVAGNPDDASYDELRSGAQGARRFHCAIVRRDDLWDEAVS